MTQWQLFFCQSKSKHVITNKHANSQGMVLVVVLIFLSVISLLAVSLLSSSTVQSTLVSNQQLYLQAATQLANAKKLVTQELTKSDYSERILQVEPLLTDGQWQGGQSLTNNIIRCNGALNEHWLSVDLTELHASSEFVSPELLLLPLSRIKTYIGVISIEQLEDENKTELLSNSLTIKKAAQSINTKQILMLKQCFTLNDEGLSVVETSIISRQNMDTQDDNHFDISFIYHNTQMGIEDEI